MIFHSKIGLEKVDISLKGWGISHKSIFSCSYPSWHWKQAEESLIKAGIAQIKARQNIQQIIIVVQQMTAAFLADWYYSELNPLTQPQLPLLASAFPESLVRPYVEKLEELYRESGADIYCKAGKQLAEKGKIKEAIACFDGALKLQSDNQEAYSYRAQLWQQQEKVMQNSQPSRTEENISHQKRTSDRLTLKSSSQPKQSGDETSKTIDTILERLQQEYPNATYELNWETPEQMLVATILAAQCTDERVNQVTATLFEKYPNPEAFAYADTATLEQDLKPTGFYKQKNANCSERLSCPRRTLWRESSPNH